MKECCGKMSLAKVTAMVTDITSNMKKARDLLVKVEGCKHILHFGWVLSMVDAFQPLHWGVRGAGNASPCTATSVTTKRI